MKLTLDEFIKKINNLRKTKNWYSLVCEVNGMNIRIKGYETWLQIYLVNGIQYGNCSDRKVKQFQEDLRKPFEDTI